MYPAKYAKTHPGRAAFIMASTGETVSYRELDERSNQLAHLLRQQGLKRSDHFSIFMENNNRYLECSAAGERTGLYYTCINHYLKGDELAYILNNSESRILIVSKSKLAVAQDALKNCPDISMCLVIGALAEDLPEPNENGTQFQLFEEAVSHYPRSLQFSYHALAVPRGYDLSISSSALPLGPAGGCEPNHSHGRNRYNYGAFRSRGLSGLCRSI